MKKLLVSLIVLFMLAGCATKWDVKLNKSDNEAIQNGQENSAWIVDSKVAAISQLQLSPGSDDIAIALMEVFKAQAIAGIKTPKFEVKKARLNTDNVPEVMSTIRQGVPFITVGVVATSAIENDRGTTQLSSEGGDITMKDSLNRTEVHSVAIDGSTASTSSTADSSVPVAAPEPEGVEE